MNIPDDVKQKLTNELNSTALKMLDQIKRMFDWFKGEDLYNEAFYARLAEQSIPLYVRWRLLEGDLSKFAEMSTKSEVEQFATAVLDHKFHSQNQFQVSVVQLTEENIRQGWSWETQIVIPAQKPTSLP